MAAGQFDITIEQGATWSYRLAVTTSAGAVVPLTGFLARSQVRKKHSSSEVAATVSCTVDAPNGLVYLALSSVQTAAIVAGEYVYDVELYDASATPVVRRLVYGVATVTPEVTR